MESLKVAEWAEKFLDARLAASDAKTHEKEVKEELVAAMVEANQNTVTVGRKKITLSTARTVKVK